ncbi:MAG: RtcB family protein, partial [Cyclobacteriaceae bacterium]|nr:RtcB family protein [Cyclobacteriaceae bacterium]
MRQVFLLPEDFENDKKLGPIAVALIKKKEKDAFNLSERPKDYSVYGAEGIEPGAIRQMRVAMRLPVTHSGALMPDAHEGYGLPIGGVMATNNAVVPYAVGVDIGCRMCLSVYDIPGKFLDANTEKLK